MVTGHRCTPPSAEPRAVRTRPVAVPLAAALSLAVFLVLFALVETRWAPLARFDAATRDDTHRLVLAHRWVVPVEEGFSALGTTVAYLVVFIPLLAVLVWLRRRRQVVFVVVAIIGSSLLDTAVKLLVDRPRPVVADPVTHAPGFSFPSGHAQAAMAGYLVLLVLVVPLVRAALRALAVAVAALMVLAIGASRVLLSVHYLSDVLAGYFLGAAWTLCLAALVVQSGQSVRRTEEP